MKHVSSFAEAPLLPLDHSTPITIDRDEVQNVPPLSDVSAYGSK